MDFTTIKGLYDELEAKGEQVLELGNSTGLDRWTRERLFNAVDYLAEAFAELDKIMDRNYKDDPLFREWGITEGWLTEGLSEDEERLFLSLHGADEEA